MIARRKEARGLFFTFVLFVVWTYPTSAQWVVEDDGCRTPQHGVGICIPVHSCKHVLTYLQSAPKPLSAADRQLLFSYHCGFQGNQAKVCCPTTPIAPLPKPDIVPDITQHRNIKLLPQTACGGIQTDDKILNGKVTALFEFPWMVVFGYVSDQEPLSFRCGGTLINDRYVLTAAHCVTNLAPRRLTTLRLGEYDLSQTNDCETHYEGDTSCADPVQDMGFEELLPHPEYSTTTYANDIALVRLNRKANISIDSVKPVCLPIAPDIRNVELKKGIVTGWGRTENSPQSNVLLKVELPIMLPSECVRRYEKIIGITDKHICAGGVSDKDSCGGDSGGPLQVVTALGQDARYVQYAVVSFGPKPCNTRGLPGVYTKISKYFDWILDSIKP